MGFNAPVGPPTTSMQQPVLQNFMRKDESSQVDPTPVRSQVVVHDHAKDRLDVNILKDMNQSFSTPEAKYLAEAEQKVLVDYPPEPPDMDCGVNDEKYDMEVVIVKLWLLMQRKWHPLRMLW